jgi:hypothetical protein
LHVACGTPEWARCDYICPRLADKSGEFEPNDHVSGLVGAGDKAETDMYFPSFYF